MIYFLLSHYIFSDHELSSNPTREFTFETNNNRNPSSSLRLTATGSTSPIIIISLVLLRGVAVLHDGSCDSFLILPKLEREREREKRRGMKKKGEARGWERCIVETHITGKTLRVTWRTVGNGPSSPKASFT